MTLPCALGKDQKYLGGSADDYCRVHRVGLGDPDSRAPLILDSPGSLRAAQSQGIPAEDRGPYTVTEENGPG